jgi:uncharacterized protein YbjQ (UPF0145 family)
MMSSTTMSSARRIVSYSGRMRAAVVMGRVVVRAAMAVARTSGDGR